MKTIKIKFCDFVGINPEDNFFVHCLKKRYNVEFSDDPEYVFYSTWGLEHLNYKCIKIFYTAEDISPDFNLCDYAIGFDDISFGDRYIRYSLFPIQDCFEDAANKHHYTEDDLAKKTEFCDYIVSNGKGDPIRTQIFHKLSEYKKVNSGGRYLNNIGGPLESKFEFQKKHKFSIAFENGAMKGYTTEKIIHSFAAKAVPIYWGNPDIYKDFNSKSFINVSDYDNLDEVLKRVIEVDENEELYRSILSEPIFEGGEIPQRFTAQALNDFLFNIFDQPYEKASRRCFYTVRSYYIENMERYKYLDSRRKKPLVRIANKLSGH